MWIVLVSAFAGAQTLSLAGVCPGPATVDLAELTPGGRAVLLLGTGEGAARVGGGPCEDVVTGFETLYRWFGPFTDSDGDGRVLLEPTVPGWVCEAGFRVLDLATCGVSEAADFGPVGAVLLAADGMAGGRRGVTSWSSYAIDLDTGTVTTLADLGMPITGLDVGPDGLLYGVTAGRADSYGMPQFLTLNPATGVPTVRATGTDTGAFSGFSWVGDTLYGWTEAGDALVTIDPWSGVVTATGFSGTSGNNCTAASEDGQMYRIFRGLLFLVEPGAGFETELGSITGMLGTDSGQGCTFHDGALYFATGSPKVLYHLDVDTLVATDLGIEVPEYVDALGSLTR